MKRNALNLILLASIGLMVSCFSNIRLSALTTAILLLTLISCQTSTSYENHLETCLQNVQTSTFEVVGTGETGVVYSGFDVKCLIGAPLPDFEAVDIDGRKVSASRLRGKVTVINFWFKKCAPCIAEIPQLNQLVDKYGNGEVNFIALTRDAKAEVQKVLDSKPFHFNQVPDAEAIIKDRFRMILGYPSTIVVDQTGHIVEVFQGAKLKTDPAVPVAAAVDTLLGQLLDNGEKKGIFNENLIWRHLSASLGNDFKTFL